MTPSGVSTPRSRCALSTAIQSRRSRTILCSGDQMRVISGDAYRAASTLGVVTDSVSHCGTKQRQSARLEAWRPDVVGGGEQRDVRPVMGAANLDGPDAAI